MRRVGRCEESWPADNLCHGSSKEQGRKWSATTDNWDEIPTVVETSEVGPLSLSGGNVTSPVCCLTRVSKRDQNELGPPKLQTSFEPRF
jgi:hypothetical protein